MGVVVPFAMLLLCQFESDSIIITARAYYPKVAFKASVRYNALSVGMFMKGFGADMLSVAEARGTSVGKICAALI